MVAADGVPRGTPTIVWGRSSRGVNEAHVTGSPADAMASEQPVDDQGRASEVDRARRSRTPVRG